MQRIRSFDLARGFTVLCMPMIHVVMLYSNPEVQQSLLGDILGFIAEGPGAQLFMLLMGVSFTFSKRISKKYVFQRALYLLVAAYALNFLKFILPLGLGLLPANLLTELDLKNDDSAVVPLILIGDILHFATFAYVILYFVSRFKHYPYLSLLLAVLVTFVSPYVWDLQTGNNLIDRVISLFNGHPPQTFFPVFPWLVYPLMGLTLGHLLRYYHVDYLLKKTGMMGISLIILSLCFPATIVTNAWLPFYRTGPADTIFHLGFVLVWISLVHWLTKKWGTNKLVQLLTFCSGNITKIYLVQWVMICWCLAITGYMQLGMKYTLVWMLLINVNTLLLTCIITLTNAKSKDL